MSPPPVSVTGEGALAPPLAAEVPAYKNPFLWVPSSYLTMGLIYITVGAVANIYPEHGDGEHRGVLVLHRRLPLHVQVCGRGTGPQDQEFSPC